MSAFRKMWIVCVSAVFCLLAVSHSAPLVCERLVHPMDNTPQNYGGRWSFVAGSLSDPAAMEALRLRDSITVYFSNSSEASTASYTQINRFGERCQYLPYNVSVEGSTFTFAVGNRFNLRATFVNTSCSDCLVMRWVVESSRRLSLDMYLLSRRRQVEQKELEEFRAQLKCYGLPAPVLMDPNKEICPEEPPESKPTAAEAAGATAI